jgi:hypothetical protein
VNVGNTVSTDLGQNTGVSKLPLSLSTGGGLLTDFGQSTVPPLLAKDSSLSPLSAGPGGTVNVRPLTGTTDKPSLVDASGHQLALDTSGAMAQGYNGSIIDPRLATIVGQTVGLAPSTSLAGSAIDPRLNTPQKSSPSPTTVVEIESQAATMYGAGTSGSETTIKAGTTTIPLGAILSGSITASGGAGSASSGTYAAFKGASSGFYYATVHLPPGASSAPAATVPIPSGQNPVQAEKINVVYSIPGSGPLTYPLVVSYAWTALTQ